MCGTESVCTFRQCPTYMINHSSHCTLLFFFLKKKKRKEKNKKENKKVREQSHPRPRYFFYLFLSFFFFFVCVCASVMLFFQPSERPSLLSSYLPIPILFSFPLFFFFMPFFACSAQASFRLGPLGRRRRRKKEKKKKTTNINNRLKCQRDLGMFPPGSTG